METDAAAASRARHPRSGDRVGADRRSLVFPVARLPLRQSESTVLLERRHHAKRAVAIHEEGRAPLERLLGIGTRLVAYASDVVENRLREARRLCDVGVDPLVFLSHRRLPDVWNET